MKKGLLKATTELERVGQIHVQSPQDKKSFIHHWHTSEVGCVGKGKARKPYEFGVKATGIAIT